MPQMSKQVVRHSLKRALWIDAFIAWALFCLLFVLSYLSIQGAPDDSKMKAAKLVSPSEFSQSEASHKYRQIYYDRRDGIKYAQLNDSNEWQKVKDATIKDSIVSNIFMILPPVVGLYLSLLLPCALISLGFDWYKTLPDK